MTIKFAQDNNKIVRQDKGEKHSINQTYEKKIRG